MKTMTADKLPCVCPYVCIRCYFDKQKPQLEPGEQVLDPKRQRELIEGTVVGVEPGEDDDDVLLFQPGSPLFGVNAGQAPLPGDIVWDDNRNVGVIQKINYDLINRTRTLDIMVTQGKCIGTTIQRRF